MIDPDSLSRHLLDQVTASGELTSPWREAFSTVPRHRFIPDTIWIKNASGGLVPLVTQTRPGGKILTPWHTAYHDGALASFTVAADGTTAEGRIIGNVAFMLLRQQRIYATIDDEKCDETTARTSHTTVAPYHVAGDYDASLAIGMTVPDCTPIYVTAEHYPDDHPRLWLADPATESWANLVHRPGADTYPVHQSGPRNL